jgi:hypothetical protein
MKTRIFACLTSLVFTVTSCLPVNNVVEQGNLSQGQQTQSQLTVSNLGSHQLTLSWPSQAGQEVTYQLAYQAGPVPPVNCNQGTPVPATAQINATTASMTVWPLVPETEYSFRVCSVDNLGNLPAGFTVSKVKPTLGDAAPGETRCPAGNCMNQGHFCCPDGMYCAAGPTDCP